MKVIELLRQRANRGKIYKEPEFWDMKAKKFSGSSISMWPNAALNEYYEREQFMFLEQHLDNLRDRAVLDVGCGTGRLSRYLAQRGARVVGLDFSAQSIAVAEAEEKPGDITYRVQSIFDLDDQNTYDIVIALGNLTVACGNADDLENALRRLHRSLKPGGQFIVIEPINRGFLHRVLDLDIKDFVKIMEKVGFKTNDVMPLHFWPARLPLSLSALWPRSVTAIGYHLGQVTMWLLGNGLVWGDYKAIAARRSDAPAVMDRTS